MLNIVNNTNLKEFRNMLLALILVMQIALKLGKMMCDFKIQVRLTFL